MRARTWSAVATGAVALLVLFSSAAHADPPGTPAGTGGGCRDNGQEVAGNAQDPDLQPFGANLVSQNAPIAPLNALFFTVYCSDEG